MKKFINFLGGLTGALALSALHETIRQVDSSAPRFDLVGEEGVNKMMEKACEPPLTGHALRTAAITGDLVSNALYFSMIGRKKKHLVFHGLAHGAVAGIGVLSLTSKVGLRDAPIAHSKKTQAMTVGYYVFGGLVTALIIKALRKDDE